MQHLLSGRLRFVVIWLLVPVASGTPACGQEVPEDQRTMLSFGAEEESTA